MNDGTTGLGFTLEEGLAVVERSRAEAPARSRDRRICTCGHQVSRHYVSEQGWSTCNPSRMVCRCETVIPIIEVTDARHFLWGTSGYGAEHALGKGISALLGAGKTFEWIEENRKCGRCKTREVDLTPCAVAADGRVSRQAEKLNGLVCASCLDEVGVA